MSQNRNLQYGGQPLIVVEGVVAQIREWQESHVGTRTHTGGGWSIGTDTSYHGQLWLKLDDGREVMVEGGGGMQLRRGHRARIAGPGSMAGVRVVALHNLSTGITQYYESEAAAVCKGVWWWWPFALGATLLLLALTFGGLLAWALIYRLAGVFVLTPAAVLLAALVWLQNHRSKSLRRILDSAMGDRP